MCRKMAIEDHRSRWLPSKTELHSAEPEEKIIVLLKESKLENSVNIGLPNEPNSGRVACPHCRAHVACTLISA